MDKHAGKYRDYDIYKHLYNCYFQSYFYAYGHADKHCTDINLYTDPDFYLHADLYANCNADPYIYRYADPDIAGYSDIYGNQYINRHGNSANSHRYPHSSGCQSMALPCKSGYPGFICGI